MEQAPLQLLYHGPDVDNGTIPVDNMVDALVGFSSAYGKLARRRQSDDVAHSIRVVGLEKGSAKILVDVVEWTAKNPGAAGVLVTASGMVGGAAYKVIKDIVAVIRGKKHLAGQPINNNFTFNGPTVMLFGQNGSPLQLSKEQFEYLQSGLLDPDLDKLTAPLEEGQIDEFEIARGVEPMVKVEARERPFFVHTTASVTTTKDNIWMEGTLNSHSKRSNRGMFHTLSGKHIPYHYVGNDIQPLLRGYAYNGIVRVLCNVRFDANMDPTSMEIFDVNVSQQVLFDPPHTIDMD